MVISAPVRSTDDMTPGAVISMFVILATNQSVRTKIPRLAETERGTKGRYLRMRERSRNCLDKEKVGVGWRGARRTLFSLVRSDPAPPGLEQTRITGRDHRSPPQVVRPELVVGQRAHATAGLFENQRARGIVP